MKKYDVWLYAVTVEAEGETEACMVVDKILKDAGVGSKVLVDYAEEIQEI
jgi:hypothetical protein